MEMRIVGVDPALAVTGYGVIEVTSHDDGRDPESGIGHSGTARVWSSGRSPNSESRVPSLGRDVRPRIVEAGVIRTGADWALEWRLSHLHEALYQLVEEHRPSAVAIEEIFSQPRYPGSALKMAYARAVAILAVAQCGCSLSHYPPAYVKRALTGNGRASKQQVYRAVQLALGLRSGLKPPDVADALAVALCHLTTAIRNRELGNGSESEIRHSGTA